MKKFRKIISLIIAVIMLVTTLPVATVSAGGDEYVITTSEPYNMWIGSSGETVRFSPEEDGWYKFYTTGDYDTYATLYNSNWDMIEYADASAEGMNFELKIKLYSGYTYYLEVMSYDLEDEDTARFDLYVTETAAAESVTITKEPDCTTVIEGFESETMDFTGMEAEFTLTDGSTVNWSFNEDENVAGSSVDVSQGNDGAGHFYVDITCDEAFERYFFTTVENPVDSFEYSGTPFEYYEGTGGYYDEYVGVYFYYYHVPENSEVTVYYKDGTNETFGFHDNILGTFIDIVDDQLTTPWVVGGDNFFTLSLLGATTNVPVTILPAPFVNATVDSAPTRDYVFGDLVFGEMDEGTYELYPEDLTGLTFTVEYSDGTKKTYTDADIDMDNGMIDDYMYTIQKVDCSTTGAYEVTLNYKGYDIKYNVDVIDSPIADIEVTKAPDRIDFEDYYYPLLYGMEVKVSYTDGTYDTVILTKENVEYILNGELIYAVKSGENTIYIYDCYDNLEEIFYSSVTCLGVKEDFNGLNYSATRDVKNITAEKMAANGDGAVLNVEYENGDKETITFETVAIYDYGFGDYEGYAMTNNGILYYSIYADYDDGEIVGYDFYTLGYDFYVDKATTPEPENPTEPSEPTDPVVTGILGDADEDGEVNIKDATAIQKHIANLINLSETGEKLADVDMDGDVNIKDATAIQKYVASIDTSFNIGKEI